VDSLLTLSHVKKYFRLENHPYFPGEKAVLRAVDDVSLTVHQGTVAGLVGESGSGKSTLAKLIVRFYLPDSGTILYKNRSVLSVTPKDQRFLRRDIQMIFQNPYLSFNPRLKIKSALGEVLKTHFSMSSAERDRRMVELLRQVNLPEESLQKYPSQFSGGQQQRLAIARALAVNPNFLVADEPVSSLDVSNQIQLLHLLKTLQQENGLTLLMISHDLRVIHQIAQIVFVMYAGKILERASAHRFFTLPAHPYSQALLAATPKLTESPSPTRLHVAGDPPDLTRPLPACPFAPRCPQAKDVCFSRVPPWQKLVSDHQVWCHFPIT